MCYSTWHLGEWHEVKESAFELLPPHPNPKYGVSMPRIRVTMYEGGLICAFSRKVTAAFIRITPPAGAHTNTMITPKHRLVPH